MAQEVTRRNACKHTGPHYDDAYDFTASLRGHSRRDLSSEYLSDRIRDGATAEEIRAVSDGIDDAIWDKEEE
jgi:hypothetical protein